MLLYIFSSVAGVVLLQLLIILLLTWWLPEKLLSQILLRWLHATVSAIPFLVFGQEIKVRLQLQAIGGYGSGGACKLGSRCTSFIILILIVCQELSNAYIASMFSPNSECFFSHLVLFLERLDISLIIIVWLAPRSIVIDHPVL